MLFLQHWISFSRWQKRLLRHLKCRGNCDLIMTQLPNTFHLRLRRLTSVRQKFSGESDGGLARSTCGLTNFESGAAFVHIWRRIYHFRSLFGLLRKSLWFAWREVKIKTFFVHIAYLRRSSHLLEEDFFSRRQHLFFFHFLEDFSFLVDQFHFA
jgi:hypothetical protein